MEENEKDIVKEDVEFLDEIEEIEEEKPIETLEEVKDEEKKEVKQEKDTKNKKIKILKYEIDYEDGILIIIGLAIILALIFMPILINRFR